MNWINNVNGSFIYMVPSRMTKEVLETFCIQSKIPNRIPKDRLHCTLIHSETTANEIKIKSHCDIISSDNHLEIWELPDKGMGIRHALVLMLNPDTMKGRYDEFCKVGVNCKYDDFKPHITLSLNVPKHFKIPTINACPNVRFIREEIKKCTNIGLL